MVPLWVKIHNIPGELLTGSSISYVASSLGKPLALDAYTTEMCNGGTTNMKYARVLIEFDAKDGWKDRIQVVIPKLDGSGKVLREMDVEYPWRPPLCDQCHIYGHDNNHCPRKVVSPQDSINATKTPTNKISYDVDDDGFQSVTRKRNQGNSNTITTKPNPKQPTQTTNQTSQTPSSKENVVPTTTTNSNCRPARINTPKPPFKPTSTASTKFIFKPKVKPTSKSTPNTKASSSNSFQALADLDVRETLDGEEADLSNDGALVDVDDVELVDETQIGGGRPIINQDVNKV